MTAFDQYLHAAVMRAAHEAREDGSATVEAGHLLLSVAVGQADIAHQVLTSAGLDHAAVRDALHLEFEHSLGAVGVSSATHGLPRPSPAAGQPKLGASAKLALERSFSCVARKRDLRPAHLLLGILRARVGTVPRALALAGVDQAALTDRVLQALENEADL